MPVYDRFVGARWQPRPRAYLLPGTLRSVAELLRRHGVHVRRLTAAWHGPVERFEVDRVAEGPPFQGHRPLELEGRWVAPAPGRAGPGWFVVDTDQPLGALA